MAAVPIGFFLEVTSRDGPDNDRTIDFERCGSSAPAALLWSTSILSRVEIRGALSCSFRSFCLEKIDNPFRGKRAQRGSAFRITAFTAPFRKASHYAENFLHDSMCLGAFEVL